MASPTPTFAEARRVWLRVGLESFGGPAGQIAVIHREVVERRGWLDEVSFARALNFCVLLPGPEAQQLATYVGYRMHGWRGGLFAGLAFVAPGAALMLVLAAAYVLAGGLPAVGVVLLGFKAAVVAIVALAVARLATRLTGAVGLRVAAGLGFGAAWLLRLPFSVIVGGALLIGAAWPAIAGAAPPAEPTTTPRPSLRHTVRVAAGWAVLWWAPVLVLVVVGAGGSIFATQATHHGLVAGLSFGGAYAALAWASQAAMTRGWITQGQVVDGLGLAETTPGPLVLVLPFLAFVGAAQHPAGLAPILAGTLAALLSLWMIFVPSFLWIFAGAPWIEALGNARRLTAATRVVAAVAVGLIAALSLGFAIHVWFARTDAWVLAGAVDLELPTLSTVRPLIVGLSIGAAIALYRKVPLWLVLPACVAVSAVANQ